MDISGTNDVMTLADYNPAFQNPALGMIKFFLI